MHVIETKNFGRISYEAESALEFPRGLPGFDERRRFLALHFPHSDPLIYLQSLEDPDLCFITIPVLVIDPRYRLQLDPEDAELIGLPAGEPGIGEDVMCLAILTMREEGPTAKLLAPLVVNVKDRRSVQAVARDSGYAYQHAVFAEEAVACS